MKLTRTIHPQIRVLDAKAGTVEYVASDETLDSYREVIKADGWRFDQFRKNAPFVDSHDYSTLEKLVGSVIDFRVDGGKLVETVKWAVDVEGNRLAKLGFDMTQAGHLKAVSVGFMPTKAVSRWDRDPQPHAQACAALGLKPEQCNAVYLEQQQIELSACIIGANPNALAKSYKAGILTDADLDMISLEYGKREHAKEADGSLAASRALRATRERFLGAMEALINGL